MGITAQVLAEQERSCLQEQNFYLQEEIKSDYHFEQIIGRSPVLRDILAHVGCVAPTEASVLITGETGTGKELIARAIHSTSKRRDKPLIKGNCAALPIGLVESELFGHDPGCRGVAQLLDENPSPLHNWMKKTRYYAHFSSHVVTFAPGGDPGAASGQLPSTNRVGLN